MNNPNLNVAKEFSDALVAAIQQVSNDFTAQGWHLHSVDIEYGLLRTVGGEVIESTPVNRTFEFVHDSGLKIRL